MDSQGDWVSPIEQIPFLLSLRVEPKLYLSLPGSPGGKAQSQKGW